MLELLFASVLSVSLCQEPVRLDVGVGRSVASDQWIVSELEDCRARSLKVLLPERPSPPAKISDTEKSAMRCTSRDASRHAFLYFASGSSVVDAAEVQKLKSLMQGNATRVTMVGYTDSQGSLALNATLARARAEAVWNVWKRLGGTMPSEGVRLEGRPLCCYQDAHDLSRNRRVMIRVENGKNDVACQTKGTAMK